MKIVASLVLLVAALAVFLSITRPKNALSRVNFLVGTSPVSLWSWDKRDGSFTVIQLPSDVATDAPGYGRYSLEALWKLGFIDKKGGALLARGLADALALPVWWFIGEKSDGLVQTDNLVTYGRSLFSLFRRRVTNIPFPTYVSLWWTLSHVRSDAIRVVDLVNNAPVAKESLPDGSVRQFLDPQRIDVVLKGRFEDERIRAENLTVGVYNTTSIQALGTSVARLLTTHGVLVVAVGNSEPEAQECRVEGSETDLQTHTASVVTQLLGCAKHIAEHEERVDLVVRLGTDYASR